MKFHRRLAVLFFLLILMLMFILGTALTCAMDLIIENQTEQTLAIFINGYKLGDTSPGDSITVKVADTGKYTITALNTEGEVVFAKRFHLELLSI
jgi:hypothetical protein